MLLFPLPGSWVGEAWTSSELLKWASHMLACFDLCLHQGFQCMFNHIFERRLCYGTLCEENDVVTRERSSQLDANSPHAPLRPVAPNGVSQTLSRNKSNTTGMVVLILVP